MSEYKPDELAALVAGLVQRVERLEEELDALREHQEVPEDVMVAIAAAVAAFLGHKATVKAVHFRQSRGWAQAGRGRVHNRSVPIIR